MPASNITVTATRQGLTSAQRDSLVYILRSQMLSPTEANPIIHHGGCIGGDAEAHSIVQALGLTPIIHPSNLPHKTMDIALSDESEIRDELPPLRRNHKMVDESIEVIALPYRFREELRSGTWATVRYAHKQGKRVKIIWPSGYIETYATYLLLTAEEPCD